MKVCIYGAGGPVAASAVRWLEGRHTLRLTDVKPLESEHETMVVDISDATQVAAAAAGMDVLVNCTVQRTDPVIAFDVNLRGAYNVLQAAVVHHVPRIVHTGPAPILAERFNYNLDWSVGEEAPLRVGLDLYAASKLLGDDVIAAFCREHPELCCIGFYYCGFYSEEPDFRGYVPHFSVHAEDAGQAFRQGVEVARDRLPSNFEMFWIAADLPQQHISVDKARRLLGYEPQHNFSHVWSRKARAAREAT